MTPQAMGRMPEIPVCVEDHILALRRTGKTISEICEEVGFTKPSQMAAVQNLCLQRLGKRDLRGPEVGHLPGKTRSYRRAGAQ